MLRPLTVATALVILTACVYVDTASAQRARRRSAPSKPPTVEIIPPPSATPDWSGCLYYFLDEPPVDFEEFVNFFVVAFPGQPASGEVSTKATNMVFRFAAVKVDGSRLTFTTKTIGGVRYSFEGQYLNKPRIANGEIVRETVIQGALRKHSRGRQVAEVEARFGCDPGGEDDN